MRLIICFDINKLFQISLNQDDIILYNGEISNTICRNINISKLELNHDRLTKDFSDEFKFFFQKEHIDNKIINLFESIYPSFYLHNFKFCILWVLNFEKFISKNVTEIIFTDYVDNIDYFPFYEAEGEVNRRLFYNNYDFISSQIMSKAINYKKNKNDVKIIIIKKHSKYLLKIRIFIRRYFLLFSKITFHLFKTIVTKKHKKSKNKYSCIFSTRSIAHSHVLVKLLPNNEDYLFHYSDRISIKSINKIFLEKYKLNNVNQYSTITFFDLFSSITDICFSLKKFKSKEKISINGVNIPLKSLFIEGTIASLESIIYSKSIYNLYTLYSDVKIIFSPEIITQYTFFLNDIFKKNNIKIAQLQTIGIDQIRQPNFINSDLFITNSFNDFNYFKNVFPNQSTKIYYWGKESSAVNTKNKNFNIKKIIYFSQPYEFAIQNEILKFLTQASKIFNFIIYFKPHPRDDIKQIMKDFRETLIYLKKEDYLEDYINFCDIAITRTSSISKSILERNIPVLNILISDLDRSIKLDFLDKSSPLIVHNLQDLNFVFNNSKQFFDNFYNYIENKILSDKQNFQVNLVKFLDIL
jgi:hypothetical protein